MIAEIPAAPVALIPAPERCDELTTTGSALDREVAALVIVSPSSYERACDLYKRVEALEKEVQAEFSQPIESARLAKDAALRSFQDICALAKRLVDPFTGARKTLKLKLGAWRVEQEKAAEAQAQTARQAAAKLAEEEALARAVLLEQSGQAAAAEMALEVQTLPAVVAAVPPPARGIAIPKTWNAQVFDLEALVRWALQDWPNRGKYVTSNERLLNQEAKARKVEDLGIPGVRGIWRHS